MTMAWIVAVLRPKDVAPHPNFPDPDYDLQPVAQLAAVVKGDPDRVTLRPESPDGDVPWIADFGVLSAKKSLLSDSIHEGLAGLVDEITQEPKRNLPRLCALALLACSAAAELDDYQTCDTVFASLLPCLEEDSVTDRFLRAVILQQRSLRFRDSGRSYAQDSIEASEILGSVTAEEFAPFSMSPGVSSSAHDSLRQVITALQRAAWSLIPPEFLESSSNEHAHAVPSRMERVRMSSTNQLLEIDRLRSYEYSRFLEASYKRAYRSRAMTVGASVPSLFHAALNLELLADVGVYRARKEVALMRLIQGMGEPGLADWADSVRLLRHAGAESELDLALSQLRAAGPLSALSKDARQILLNRADGSRLRQVELKVLQAAAEVLTVAEASNALSAVLRVLEHGSIPPFPGAWQRSIIGLESAWRAAAALANAAGDPDVVAGLLLTEARASDQEDDLRDRAISRSLRSLDWNRLTQQVKQEWWAWISEDGGLLPYTLEVAQLMTGYEVSRRGVGLSGIDDLANRLISAMRGKEVSGDVISAGIEITSQELSRIRSNAKSGVWHMGGVDVADVAASLICFTRGEAIWPELAEFLVDASVQRDDRSPAFDRLASNVSKVEIPEAVEEVFRRSAGVIFDAPNREFLSQDTLVPYPAALRFYACYGLIDEMQVFSYVAKLAGRSEALAREEAAKTAAALAGIRGSDWLLAVSVQLSHDADIKAKAHAGRALALLAAWRPDFEKIVADRLIELLNEDGLLVPFYVLSELAAVRGGISSPVYDEIQRLQESHPSRLVREKAKQLLTPA